MNRPLRALILSVALADAAPLLASSTDGGTVAGVVAVSGADGQAMVVPGVTLTLTCGAAAAPLTQVSDAQGEYRFTDVPVGTCAIVADLQGFKSARQTLTVKAAVVTAITLHLDLDTLTQEVEVRGSGPEAEGLTPARVERMTQAELQTAPLASERFQDALPLIPGVVRGPDGLLNINGTRSNQSALVFDDADGTDPVTGEHALELPIDAVRSVRVRGAAYSPEFGQSVGAVTTVETQQGGASWHVTLNDLEPRLRRRGGEFRGIESFTPRVTIGGPLGSRKISLLQSVQYELSQTQVFGLPPFESDTKVQAFESFSRIDWTVSDANRMAATAAISPRKTTFAGLNTLNPQPVTPTIFTHGTLATAADQAVFDDHGVLEVRASVKEFDAEIYPSVGNGPMVLAPEANSGSYFNTQDRRSRRIESSASYSVSPRAPAHLFKFGIATAREQFTGEHASRPVEIVRRDGTRAELIAFAGPTRIAARKAAVSAYAQDTWTAGPRVTVHGGMRADSDSITGALQLAPRGSVTALLSRDGRTVARGGFGLFYNPVPLNVPAFAQLQHRVVTHFADDGLTTTGGPDTVAAVGPARVTAPRATNWSVEVDREWIANVFVRLGYHQRQNEFEPVVTPVRDDGRSVVAVTTSGQSTYRAAQATARYAFRAADQLVVSYTRSTAVGSLNDLNSFFGNVENPVIQPDETGPLPWDAPHRLVAWANVTLPSQITVFPLVDLRSGFPLSIMDETRRFVGPRNSERYPRFFSLDMQVSKRFRLFGHNATIGVKIFNVTAHFNPRDFQGNLGSMRFGEFANSVGRTFRGRWIFEF